MAKKYYPSDPEPLDPAQYLVPAQAPTPEAMAKEQLLTQLCSLRIAGWSCQQIAAAHGMEVKEVALLLRKTQRKLRRRQRQDMADHMALELARLDEYTRCLWRRILTGDVRAVEAALKIGERRAKLLGLDAPVQSSVTVDASVQSLSGPELEAEALRLGLPLPPPHLSHHALPGELPALPLIPDAEIVTAGTSSPSQTASAPLPPPDAAEPLPPPPSSSPDSSSA